MHITSIRIFPVQRSRVKALVDLVLENGFAINELRIVELVDGRLSLQYPISQVSTTNKSRYVCNPINRDTQQAIEAAVLEEYERMIIT